MNYTYLDEAGSELATGECKGRLDEENLTILPKFGNVLLFPLRDIVEVIPEGYRITLPLICKEKLTLFYLGYHYKDFLRVLTSLRNEVLIKDLLMQENLRKSGVEMEFVYFDETGKEKQGGKGEARLYETGLVIIPERGDIFRIPYSDISDLSQRDYSVIFNTEFGEKLIVSKMGYDFDPFLKTLSDINDELQLKVLSSLKELIPGASPTSWIRVARFMREGKAARRADIEAVDPKMWLELEKRISSVGLEEPYKFLKGISREERICIGLKRGLMGDLTGEYLWFLVPIYSSNSKEPGNAVAMEATTGEGGGKATYFFRMVSREAYPNYSLDELDQEADKFIKRINRCMLDINFRREPIYLPDKKLEEPAYFNYKFAVQKLASLRTLRNLFVGRVIHATPEQWKKDVMDLLRFNVSTLSNEDKW